MRWRALRLGQGMKRWSALLIPLFVAAVAVAALFHVLKLEEKAWAAAAPAAAPEAISRTANDQVTNRRRAEIGSVQPAEPLAVNAS